MATLVQHADLSLAQRAAALNMQAGGKLYSRASLRQVYRQQGVKCKATCVHKVAVRQTAAKQLQAQLDTYELKRQVRKLLEDGYNIVQVDETCYTWRGYKKQAWAPRKHNMHLTWLPPANEVSIACVGAIDADRGKMLFHFRPRSFDGDAFFDFFEELCRKLDDGQPWCMMLDNCSIHRTLKLKARAAELGIPLVFNVAYSPQYMGIETFWANTKRAYKQMGVKTMLAGRQRDILQEARDATFAVSDVIARKCARHGYKMIGAIRLPEEATEDE